MLTEHSKPFPPEHLPVLKHLIEKLMQQTLHLPLQVIDTGQAYHIKQKLMDVTGVGLSEKKIKEIVNSVAEINSDIKKYRDSTLSIMAKYVMKKTNGNGKNEAFDRENYWVMFLNNHFESNNLYMESEIDVVNIRDTLSKIQNPDVAISVSAMKDTDRKILESSVFAGFLLGAVNAFYVILFPNIINGYWDYNKNISGLIPRISLTNISAGIVFGLLCGYFGSQYRKEFMKNFMNKFLLSIFILCVFIFSKQSAARGAWDYRLPYEGSDFETIAYYFAILIGTFGLLGVLRNKVQMRAHEIFKTALRLTLFILLPLVFTYAFYLLFIAESSLAHQSLPSEDLKLFIFQFNHPERILLILAMAFSSIFIMLKVRYFWLRDAI